MERLRSELFLSSWADINGDLNTKDEYIDYDALIESDDEYLCLSSLFAVDELAYE